MPKIIGLGNYNMACVREKMWVGVVKSRKVSRKREMEEKVEKIIENVGR